MRSSPHGSCSSFLIPQTHGTGKPMGPRVTECILLRNRHRSPHTRGKGGRKTMAYWLVKSEPDDWSWTEQVAKGREGAEWTHIRNFAAQKHLRAMKKGERAFFYHTGKERAIVGIVEVIAEAHPDS